MLQVDRTCYNKCSVLKRFISVKALSGLGSRWFVRTLYCILMSKLEYTRNSSHAITARLAAAAACVRSDHRKKSIHSSAVCVWVQRGGALADMETMFDNNQSRHLLFVTLRSANALHVYAAISRPVIG